VPLELKYLSKPEADALYFGFLDELGWAPTEETRQKFFLAYDTAATVVTNLLQWRRVGAAPPKAEIDPE